MKYYIFFVLAGILAFMGCQSNKSWLEADLAPSIWQQENTKEFFAVDPQNKEFGGGRGFNQMTVYTPAFGTQTGTNQWGTEAIVRNGHVVSIGGNNSAIPEDGFVISGNESERLWIIQNLSVGMEVELHEKSLTYADTENSLILQARDYYQRAQSRFDEGKMTDQQLLEKTDKQLQEDFNALLKAKKSGDAEKTLECSRQLLSDAQKLFYTSYEPLDGEFKGIWIRLADKTPDELKATIKKIAETGFNAILPETVYNGYAIYPDAHPLLPQLPQFEGWDPLQLMIDECEKYNIQVIPWCELFFVGGENSPLVAAKPEWIGEFRTGKRYSDLEAGYHYLCPSRPEVADFILSWVDTLLSRYPVQQIQYDYIRYSLSEPWEKGYCYCDYCRKKVQKDKNFDILAITPENEEEWKEWNEYRINNITNFVIRSNQFLKEQHPGVLLSVDVVSNPQESLEHKFQNWESWVQNNLVDEIYIMNYYVDNESVRKDTESLKKIVSGSNIAPIVGLGPFMKLEPETLLDQIEITRENGARGVCLFAFNSMSPEQLEALKYGPFRNL